MPLIRVRGRSLHLTPSQYETYLAIATAASPPSSREIAEARGKAPNTVWASLQRLERAGCVERINRDPMHPRWIVASEEATPPDPDPLATLEARIAALEARIAALEHKDRSQG